jgi:hypothetical protein
MFVMPSCAKKTENFLLASIKTLANYKNPFRTLFMELVPTFIKAAMALTIVRKYTEC